MPINADSPIIPNGFPTTTHSAEEAMFMWETHGKKWLAEIFAIPKELVELGPFGDKVNWKLMFQKLVAPQEQETLELYLLGKEQRDFHITEWLAGVKDRLFMPEEFYGVLGMVSPSEFRGVFGRDLNLHLLEIRALELQEEIRFYERLLS